MKLQVQFCLVLCSILFVRSGNNEIKNENSQSKYKQSSFRTKRKSNFPFTTSSEGKNNFQCAVMYKNNEPVGILQPWKNSYMVLPVEKSPIPTNINLSPVKRTPRKVGEKVSYREKLGYLDNRYPLVLTQFKIHSKLGSKNNVKRSMDQRYESLVSRRNSVSFEDELENILDEMSLMDEYHISEIGSKVEDELSEPGANRLNSDGEKNKRNVSLWSKRDESIEGLQRSDISLDSFSGMEGSSEDIQSNNTNRVFSRKTKRSEKESSSLSKSDVDKIKENEGLDQKRSERNIFDKIRKLKDNAWKKVKKLKGSKNYHIAGDNQRKKRQIVNTLLDAENSDIDPNLNGDEDDTIHIRRKRDVLFDN